MCSSASDCPLHISREWTVGVNWFSTITRRLKSQELFLLNVLQVELSRIKKEESFLLILTLLSISCGRPWNDAVEVRVNEGSHIRSKFKTCLFSNALKCLESGWGS